VVTGFGELLGYALRLFSGRGADRTGRYWPITIGGYILQMSVVPLLALAGSWQVAALLIILERVGKATRNPPRDAMLSHATKEMGYGWGFGVHEALDQFGALFGPLLVALIIATSHHDYKAAFAALAVPAAITLSLLAVADTSTRGPGPRGRPAEREDRGPATGVLDLPRGSGTGGRRLRRLSNHGLPLPGSGTVHADLIPVFYAAAMAISGTGSLVFGRLFDRHGIGMLVPLTMVAALSAPLAFLGGFWSSWSECVCGGSGWACTSRSFRPRLRRWSRRTDGRPRPGCSPAPTGSPGSWEAPRSAPCSAFRWAWSSRSLVTQLAAIPLILRPRRGTTIAAQANHTDRDGEAAQ